MSAVVGGCQEDCLRAVVAAETGLGAAQGVVGLNEVPGDGCAGSDVYVVWAGVLGRSGVGAAHDADCFLRGERGPAVDVLGGWVSHRLFWEEAVIDVLDLAEEKGGLGKEGGIWSGSVDQIPEFGGVFVEGADVQEQAVDGVVEVVGISVCREHLQLVAPGTEVAVPAGVRSVGVLVGDDAAVAETSGVKAEEGLGVITEAGQGVV
ncbi:hypothetical protein NDU88_002027 [Pleurodeles waltl]|uniref:Uncharacterized protein n=1 Tax=Pleurodeles waltl TaxID=8319 RepID=A0AAV7U8U4_PLEWA|nr:hypothetical protein NDU88_002027 [Pleurodeles waltl]